MDEMATTSIPSATVPGRFYRIDNGKCTCPAASFGRKCRHLGNAADIEDREREIMARGREMTEKVQTIHTAIADVYKEVGYVQKLGKVASFGATYRYASEADLIAAIRPALVDHEVYLSVASIADVRHESFTTAKGSPMNRVSLIATIRFTHGPSGTSIDVMSAGEGMDSGDKATPKALTGAYKYALRQTFAIETGDDPDVVPSTEQERHTVAAPVRQMVRSAPFGVDEATGELPPFPEPRGTEADEWKVLTNYVVANGPAAKAAIQDVIGGFSINALDSYFKSHAGMTAAGIIERSAQTAGHN